MPYTNRHSNNRLLGGPPNHHFNAAAAPHDTSFGGGRKRPFNSSGQGDNNNSGGGYAKLYIGSVPSSATEGDIRPLFEKHGNVVEVIFVKDKKTGQQKECCFIKYASFEEAERAIKALNNKYTLRGEFGPIQVRYAGVEREHHPSLPSTTEVKLYVAQMNKQATEKEIEEIFCPYGRVEDIFIMRDATRQSSGCAFIKFSERDMAVAAINALNGTFTMTGCHQPLIVRFADPRRHKPGEYRSDNAFQSSGFSPSVHPPFGTRPEYNHGDPTDKHVHPNPWKTSSLQSSGPPFDGQGFVSHSVPKTDAAPLSVNMSSLSGNVEHEAYRTHATTSTEAVTTATPSMPSSWATACPICEWSEHTCPDGFKYYYNCLTKESRWEMPKEFTSFKQQHKKA